MSNAQERLIAGARSMAVTIAEMLSVYGGDSDVEKVVEDTLKAANELEQQPDDDQTFGPYEHLFNEHNCGKVKR